MFQVNKKQYLFRTSFGKIQNLFYKPNCGICTSTANNKNTWTEPTVILEDILPNFSACIDNEDTTHILAQHKNGSIIHMYYEKDKWHKNEILKDTDSVSYDKHPSIICFGQTIYTFFVLEREGKKILAFQAQDQSNASSTPQFIDYVKNSSSLPYRLLKHNNILYIFYNHIDDKYNGIGYRVYDETENKWSSFSDVAKCRKDQDCEILSVIPDCKDNLHVCWQKMSSLKYEFMYSRKVHYCENWEEKVLATSPYAFFNSSLLAIRDRIIAYWIRDKNILYCISENNGDKWSGPKNYAFYSNKPFYCILYMENPANISSGTYFNNLPGNFANGYSLGFINDFSYRKEKNMGMDDLQTLMLNTLKTVSTSIDELKKTVEDLKQRMNELELKQKNSEAELNMHITKSELTTLDVSNIKLQLEFVKEKVEKLETMEIKEQVENALKHAIKSVEENNTVQTRPEQDHSKGSDQAEIGVKKGANKNVSILPGTGFASITPEYLRSLNKNF